MGRDGARGRDTARLRDLGNGSRTFQQSKKPAFAEASIFSLSSALAKPHATIQVPVHPVAADGDLL
jgi:hypothetical protein